MRLSVVLKALVALVLILLLVLLIKPLTFPKASAMECREADYDKFVSLPLKGQNYKAYSWLGYSLGRAYMREPAAAAVVKAYEELSVTRPDLSFIYGEIGGRKGGEFRPHKTHQDGRSADFITPMTVTRPDGTIEHTNLPVSIFNLWTYRTRFDDNGNYRNMHMDTDAIIAHLAALRTAAACYGMRISRVILDPPLQEVLRRDPRYGDISDLPFMATPSWFPHDSHYHVDFEKIN